MILVVCLPIEPLCFQTNIQLDTCHLNNSLKNKHYHFPLDIFQAVVGCSASAPTMRRMSSSVVVAAAAAVAAVAAVAFSLGDVGCSASAPTTRRMSLEVWWCYPTVWWCYPTRIVDPSI